MSQNALYNVLKSMRDSSTYELSGLLQVKFTKNQSGKNYFLLELPQKKQFYIGNLTLLNHHLSIYEGSAVKHYLSSQYHYTAYFESQNKKQYRLHVYFNKDDIVIERPIVQLYLDDGQYGAIEDNHDQDESFITLAQRSSQAVMKQLRSIQNKLIQGYQHDARQNEKKAEQLSIDIVKNKKEYILTIENQLIIMGEMGSIAHNSDPVFSMIRFYKKLKESVENLKETPVFSTEKGNDNTQLERKEEIKKVSIKRHKKEKIEKSPSSTTQPKSTSISNKLNTIRQIFATEKQKSQRVFIELFLDALSELKYLDTKIYLDNLNIPVTELNELNQLNQEVEKIGRRLLERLLLENDFTTAEKMTRFIKEVRPEILLLSLHTPNANLLDFLLQNNLFSIYYAPIKIKDTHYDSMIDYCFKTCTTNNTNADLLSVLIKHKASLLTIDNTTGLPYSANLLLDTKHPLYGILSIETLKNPQFYRRLNQTLSVLEAECLESDANKKTISKLIESNNEQIKQLNLAKSIYGTKVSQEISLFCSSMQDTSVKNLINALTKDQEINAISALVSKRLNEVLPLMEPKERNNFRNYTSLSINSMKNILEKIEDCNLLPPFHQLKDQTITSQMRQLRALDLREELYHLQKDKGFININSKSGRKNLSRQRIIIKELNQFNSDLNAQLKNVLQVKTLLKELENFADSLNEELKNESNLIGNFPIDKKKHNSEFLSLFFKGTPDIVKQNTDLDSIINKFK